MHKKYSNKGFSLVELLIAVAILSIIMVMISTFVSSTLITNRKTKKNLQVQDEAQRIYYQIADTLMQATYIRVSVEDGSDVYVYNDSNESYESTSSVSVSTGAVDLVPDNYANYESGLGYDSQKVIVDFDNYDICNEKSEVYPVACTTLLDNVKAKDSSTTELVDEDDKTNAATLVLKSFRSLTRQYKKDVPVMESVLDPLTGSYVQQEKKDASGNTIVEQQKVTHSYYVIPKYIYIEYSNKDAVVTEDPATHKVTSVAQSISCVMYKFDSANHKIYVYRSDPSKKVPEQVDYKKAKAEVDSSTSFISDNVQEFYFNADADANAVKLAMVIENEKYTGYRYRLNETVNIRNDNVLSVKPQLLNKIKGTGELQYEP